MDLVVSSLPLLLLIGLMTFGKGMASYRALPLVAFLLYVLQLFYFRQDGMTVHASVLAGFLTAATPLSILFGAIFFFKTMEVCGSLALVRRWLDGITPHPVGQAMLIGWAFSFFIEGISGFGTPAVMAAPLLVSLGFEPFRVVVMCLAMNTVPVAFGAVGTPMWFGFGELGLSAEALREIGFKTALIHTAAAAVIPVWALSIAVSWKTVRRNLSFVYLSIASAVIPYLLLAKWDVEFPSIAGGFVSMLVTVYLAKKRVGLSDAAPKGDHTALTMKEYARAFSPFAAIVAILLVTRIQQFGLREWLTSGASWIRVSLNGVGEWVVSSSLVVELQNIFFTSVGWKHALLYVPSLLPFGVVALVCLGVFRVSWRDGAAALSASTAQLLKPGLALVGAMIFVKLFVLGGERAPAFLLGKGAASYLGDFWNFAAVYLGALGAFFAGSCTISNLTFGPIQAAVAQQVGMDLSIVLSLQSVGGAMGNMVCIHNIVAASAVLGLHRQEGKILRKVFLLALVYGLIAGGISFMLK